MENRRWTFPVCASAKCDGVIGLPIGSGCTCDRRTRKAGENVEAMPVAEHDAAMANARHERNFWSWKYERREAECEELADRLRAKEETISEAVQELERRAARAKAVVAAPSQMSGWFAGNAYGLEEAASLLRDKAEEAGK